MRTSRDVSICARLRNIATLDEIKRSIIIDDISIVSDPVVLDYISMIEACDISISEFVRKYLYNIQPYIINMNLTGKYLVIDMGYMINMCIDISNIGRNRVKVSFEQYRYKTYDDRWNAYLNRQERLKEDCTLIINQKLSCQNRICCTIQERYTPDRIIIVNKQPDNNGTIRIQYSDINRQIKRKLSELTDTYTSKLLPLNCINYLELYDMVKKFSAATNNEEKLDVINLASMFIDGITLGNKLALDETFKKLKTEGFTNEMYTVVMNVLKSWDAPFWLYMKQVEEDLKNGIMY